MHWQTRLLAVVLAAGVSACGAPDTAGPAELNAAAGDAPSATAADPEAGESRSVFPELRPDISAAPAGPTPAEELAAVGVTVESGFSPHEHLGRTNGILNWPPLEQMPEGIGDPPVPAGLGPLKIAAEVAHEPIWCIQYARTIAGVDVGDGPAAGPIAAEIVRVAREQHDKFSQHFRVDSDCDGLHPDNPASHGNTYQELAEEPCELPRGPALRCFVLADFGFPPAAAHTYLWHYQLVFERDTGVRLDVPAMLGIVGLDPTTTVVRVNGIVETVTGAPRVEIRQARPTREGLVFGFSPYEAGSFAEYTRDVFIPWDVLASEPG